MTAVYIIGVIIILAILILVHEFGHFMAAKLIGVPVKIFSIGFPAGSLVPPLYKFKWGETECQINIILLGGFCAFMDDDTEKDKEVDSDDKRYLKNRTALERLWVISAGVLANAIFSYIVLVVMVFTLGVSSFFPKDGVRIVEYPASESPAYKAGIKAGDRILSVGGILLKRMQNKETTDLLKELIEKNKGKTVKLAIERGHKSLEIMVTPSTEGRIGVSITPDMKEVRRPIENVFEPFIIGGTTFGNITVKLIDVLGKLFTGKIGLNQIGGPIAVGKMGVDIAENDPTQLFIFTALIGIELVIINLLPIPALDGGHIFFIILEIIRRRPLSKKLEESLLYGGVVILICLGVLLIFKDLYSTFTGRL